MWFFLIVLALMPFLPNLFPKKAHWSVGLLIADVPLTLGVIVWTVLDKNDAYDAWRGYLIHFISVVGGVAFYRYGVFDKARLLLSKAKLDKWWIYLLVSLLGLALLGIFQKGIIAPYALLPLLFFFVSIFDEHKMPRWMDFLLSWLGKLSMPLWFIHYAFFAGYVNEIVPLFDFVSSARVGRLSCCLPW